MPDPSNIIAAIGTLLVVVAIGALAGFWWGVLVLGVFLLLSSYAMHRAAATVGPVVRSQDVELRAVA